MRMDSADQVGGKFAQRSRARWRATTRGRPYDTRQGVAHQQTQRSVEDDPMPIAAMPRKETGMATSTPATVPTLANVITLGVRDLTTMRDFYRAFGWPLVVEMDDFYA